MSARRSQKSDVVIRKVPIDRDVIMSVFKIGARGSKVSRADALSQLNQIEQTYSPANVSEWWQSAWKLVGDSTAWSADEQAAACVMVINFLVRSAKDRVISGKSYDRYMHQLEIWRARLADLMVRYAYAGFRAGTGGAKGRRSRIERRPRPDYRSVYAEVVRTNPEIGRMDACRQVLQRLGRNNPEVKRPEYTVWKYTKGLHPKSQ